MTRRRRRLLRLLLPALATTALAGAAWGFWSGEVAAGGHGVSAAAVLEPGHPPSATVTGRTVTLSWEPTTLSSAVPAGGYLVTRYDEETRTPQPVGADCGATEVPTCTELEVPEGRWRYSVTPTIGTSWRGPTSADSDPVVVDVTGPTGGSVELVGLAGTGSAYSTSRTLTLRLSPGTDPNGVATAGGRLLRASAPLEGGGCGGYGSFTLVAEGTDLSSPFADPVPESGRCYRYRYQVTDTLGNRSSFTSAPAKVDTTAPAPPTVTLTAATGSSAQGSVVYYRPDASGSFTVAAQGSDAQSGIAHSTFPALGDGWSSTPAGPGAATYSWSGAPEVPGTGTVTTTNNAGSTSTGTTFRPVPDSTPPSPGTVDHVDGLTTADHVVVTFSSGTDPESGLAGHLLQRSSAPLTGETCGAFGAFETVAHGVDAASPRRDPVQPGSCYRYRLTVHDQVGNTQTTLGAGVARVVESAYASAVQATAGLTHYWRLSEEPLHADSFTGPAGTGLDSHDSELGSWAGRPEAGSSEAVLTGDGRLRRNTASSEGSPVTYSSAAPPDTTDYTVEADLFVASTLAADTAALTARTAPGSADAVTAGYDQATRSWRILRQTGSATTVLATSAPEPVEVGRTYHVAFDVRGTQLRLLVDGVERLEAVDPAVTAGSGGVLLGSGGGTSAAPTDTTGMHLDDFRVTPAARDATGTHHGSYRGAPALGLPGPAPADEDTAVRLDGTDDAVRVRTALTDDFSVELWFRATRGAGAGTSWRDGAAVLHAETATGEELGISLASDGRVVAGMGTSVASSAAEYADGAWHHVVLTRTGATGALTLHLDGTLAGTTTGSTAAVAGPARLALGAGAASPAPRFAGDLDEVALYEAPLPATTVAAHHAAAR